MAHLPTEPIATGHGAFFGLLGGSLAAALHHGLTLPRAASVGVKGGWINVLETYPSEMAQNFWTAIYAFTACFVLTIAISLMTKPRDEKSLVGLVYALTPRESSEGTRWYARPASLGLAVLAAMILLNLSFW